MTIILASLTLAITGSGGGININAMTGMSSYDVSGSLNSRGISSNIVGLYSGGTIFGGLGNYGDPYANMLSISALSPVQNSGINGNSVYITFNISGNSTIVNCSLYLNNALYGALYGPTAGINSILVTGLTNSTYQWNVLCTNGTYTVSTDNMTFSVILTTTFDNQSTDLSTVNMQNITDLTLSKTDGKIVFDTTVNISGSADLDSNVIITHDSITINSAQLPFLNKPATLTMNSVPYSNVAILRDGVQCIGCSIISLNSGTLIFTVPGFSTYTITGTTSMKIFDSSDLNQTFINQSTGFYANYTNATSGQPIIGTCTISFDLGGWTAPQSMSYNGGTGLYEYYRTFNQSLSSQFNVSCAPSGAGFDSVSLLDAFTISGNPTTFSSLKIDVGQSSSMNINHSAAILYTSSGNITSLFIHGESVTKSWQGYYGNFTGRVLLADVNNNSLYDWDNTNVLGEIYASRSSVISWNSVQCANHAQLVNEDVFINANSTDGDTVVQTFSNATSFSSFYTGNVLVDNSTTCYATNMYDDSGPQNSHFYEILLTDGTNMIYTGILDTNVIGFDTSAHDFEMMVGEDGHNNNNPTTYYFFAEVG